LDMKPSLTGFLLGCSRALPSTPSNSVACRVCGLDPETDNGQRRQATTRSGGRPAPSMTRLRPCALAA
jgi:hypothetical protein